MSGFKPPSSSIKSDRSIHSHCTYLRLFILSLLYTFSLHFGFFKSVEIRFGDD